MIPRPPRSTRTDTLFPYTTLFRSALRRHATLAAQGIRLEESLTDATLTMFDKLLGSMLRRAENRTRDKALKTVRELQGHLRTLTGRSEEHTSELQSLMRISYAVFCLKKKTNNSRTVNT